MKRKKIKCNRPLLELPEGHAVRLRLEKDIAYLSEWRDTVVDGCKFKVILSHEDSIRLLSRIDPEVLKKASLTTSSFIQTNYTQGDSAISLVSSFIPPDADDHDRVETGWSVMVFHGPKSKSEEIRQMAISATYHAREISSQDRYIDG